MTMEYGGRHEVSSRHVCLQYRVATEEVMAWSEQDLDCKSSCTCEESAIICAFVRPYVECMYVTLETQLISVFAHYKSTKLCILECGLVLGVGERRVECSAEESMTSATAKPKLHHRSSLCSQFSRNQPAPASPTH